LYLKEEEMEKCCWKSNISEEKCYKPKYDDSDFCLFHKPEKNQTESALFWEVINLNFFKFLPDHVKILLKIKFGITSDALTQFPEIGRVIATGLVQHQLDDQASKLFGMELRKARQQYISTSQNTKFAIEALSLYDVAQLHGSESGWFIGFVFPKFLMKFDYQVNDSAMINGGIFVFEEAIFEGIANFEDYNFKEYDVQFDSCQFKQVISFSGAQFHKCVTFKKCNLNTSSGIIGKQPFYNAHFSGEFLHFSGGSLCTLYGIKLSEYTDLIIDEDVDTPNYSRIIGYSAQQKNIRDEIFTIAKKQAERTGNISLINKYDDTLRKFRFNYQILLDDIIEIGTVLQKRMHTRKIEDLYNDFYKDALTFKGYRAQDQTRAGSSASGKSAGELDIEISNDFGIPFSILEAFRLNSLNQSVIVEHINKLLHKYDTSGHEKNIVIAYCEIDRFDQLVAKYNTFLLNKLNTHELFEKRYPTVSTSEIAYGKTDIRVFECKHDREGKEVYVFHVLIKIKVP
jgi:hypothetical protein